MQKHTITPMAMTTIMTMDTTSCGRGAAVSGIF